MARRRAAGEGSVYQRSDGRWAGAVDMGWQNGRRVRKTLYGRTKREVLDKLRDAQRAHDDGTLTAGRIPTVAVWMRHWLSDVAPLTLRDSTLDGYRSKTEHRIIPALGRHRLDQLRPEHLQQFYSALVREGLAASTVRQIHWILSGSLDSAWKAGRIRLNPCERVSPPTVRRAEATAYDAEDARRIIAVTAGRRNAARWSMALALGLRQGESLGLLWPAVDLDQGVIEVAWELQRIAWRHGCADPTSCRLDLRPMARAAKCPERTGGGVVLEPPKSEKSRRTVRLPDFLTAQLRAHRQAQLADRLAIGPAWFGWGHDCDRRPRPKELVCPSCRRPIDGAALVFAQRDGRPIGPRQDWGEWKDILVAAGVHDGRLHEARHTAATLFLEQGFDVRVVQEILGHSSSQLTRDTYQHVTSRLQAAAADTMGDLLWGDRPERARGRSS